MQSTNRDTPRPSAGAIKMERRTFIRYGLEAGLMIGLVGGLSVIPTNASYLRPPRAIKEANFSLNCIKCGNCVEVCPTSALEQMDLSLDLKNLGTPVLNPKHGGCIAWNDGSCQKCADACPSGALSPEMVLKNQRLGVATIRKNGCINCMLCFQKCPIPGAVLFPNSEGLPYTRDYDIPTHLKLVDSPVKPIIDPDKCVGCGLCAHYCPPRVIDLKPLAKVGRI